MSKETAFYPRLKAMTDEWMDLFGYWAPTEVTDTQEEYRAVRETAGLMDFSMLRKLDIEGPGAQDFVNTIVTRDVSRLTPGPFRHYARREGLPNPFVRAISADARNRLWLGTRDGVAVR